MFLSLQLSGRTEDNELFFTRAAAVVSHCKRKRGHSHWLSQAVKVLSRKPCQAQDCPEGPTCPRTTHSPPLLRVHSVESQLPALGRAGETEAMLWVRH